MQHSRRLANAACTQRIVTAQGRSVHGGMMAVVYLLVGLFGVLLLAGVMASTGVVP